MGLFKLIFNLLIVLSSTLMGFLYGGTYSKRANSLNNLLYCIRILETEVIIGQTPLPDALEKVSVIGKGEIASVFKNIEEDLIENKRGEVYYSFLAVEPILRERFLLTNADIDALLSFSKVIGKTNRDDQKKSFAIVLNQIQDLEISANEEKLKNEKFYRSLGVLMGLTIAIILI